MCCSGMSRYGTIRLLAGDRLDQLVGEVHRVEVHQPDPVEALDLLQLAQQLDQPRLAVQVHAVVGRVLGDDDQLAHAVGGQLAGLGDDFFDRLGGVLAAHLGDRAERAQPVAAFGDLQKREVPRRDPQPGRVGQRMRRRRLEHGPLLGEPAEQPVGDLGDLLAAEDADEVIDLRAARRAATPSAARPGSRTRSRPAARPCRFSSSISSIAANDSCRAASMKPQVLTTTKSAPVRLVHQLVAVELQQAEHPLAVDEVLRAAQADEAVRALRAIPARPRIGRRPRRGSTIGTAEHGVVTRRGFRQTKPLVGDPLTQASGGPVLQLARKKPLARATTVTQSTNAPVALLRALFPCLLLLTFEAHAHPPRPRPRRHAPRLRHAQRQGNDDFYFLGPDSLPHDGVPHGETKGPFVLPSQAYPGTQHAYWVYVPAQYDGKEPAALMVFQDGHAFLDPEGRALPTSSTTCCSAARSQR